MTWQHVYTYVYSYKHVYTREHTHTEFPITMSRIKHVTDYYKDTSLKLDSIVNLRCFIQQFLKSQKKSDTAKQQHIHTLCQTRRFAALVTKHKISYYLIHLGNAQILAGRHLKSKTITKVYNIISVF